MKHFKLLVSLCVLWSALPIQAATYSGGKTAWRVPGGKWSPARIEVGNGLVEVHAVRGGLQASFNKDNFSPLEVGGFAGTGTEKKARWGVRIAGLAILTGSLLFLDSRMAQKREEEDLLCSGDRFDSDPCLDAQEKIDYGGLFTVGGRRLYRPCHGNIKLEASVLHPVLMGFGRWRYEFPRRNPVASATTSKRPSPRVSSVYSRASERWLP